LSAVKQTAFPNSYTRSNCIWYYE